MCDIKKNKQLDRFMTSKQNLLAGRLISIIVFQYTRCWKLRKYVGEVNVWSQKQIGTTVGSFYPVFTTKIYLHRDFKLTIQLIMRAM